MVIVVHCCEVIEERGGSWGDERRVVVVTRVVLAVRALWAGFVVRDGS